MSGSLNFCEKYVSLIPYHKNLKLKCKSLTSAIQDEKDRRKEEREVQFQISLPKLLKELNDNLYEKLELLKMKAFDLVQQSVNVQNSIKALENESTTHQQKINMLNKKIDDVQKSTNLKIHTTRDDFLRKYRELMDFKCRHEDTEKIIDESCKLQISIEKDLNTKRKELRGIMCKIKKQRESMEPNINIQQFNELRNAYEEKVKKLSQLNSTINCIQDKLCQAQHEDEITRRVYRSKLKIIKEHDDWSRQDLIKRKCALEKSLKRLPIISEDRDIQSLSHEILVMQKRIEISEESIEQLRNTVDEIHGWKRPCVKSMNFSPAKVTTIIATDYMGSTFYALQ